MTTKFKLALLSTLASVATHIYLTLHFYQVKLGMGDGQSFCNISETFDCDAVSASSYSELLGIPLSIWGGTSNFLLLIILCGLGFRLVENRAQFFRFGFWLSAGIALASLVMGGISLSLLGTYCLFCMVAYGLSFVTFALLAGSQEGAVLPHFAKDITTVFTDTKAFLVSLVVVPGASYMIHNAILSSYEAQNLPQIVSASIAEWKVGPKVELDTEPLLSMGPSREKAKVTLSEFADFLCIHCKMAAPTLHAFVKAHPDVRFEFFVFPLDKTCNPAIPNAYDGLRCYLPKTIHCLAKEDQNKAWALHKFIFDQQAEFGRGRTIAAAEKIVKGFTDKHSVAWDKLSECVKDPDVHDKIEAQGKLGDRAKIQGTPAIFMNGKKLVRGQLIPVLQGARQEALKAL